MRGFREKQNAGRLSSAFFALPKAAFIEPPPPRKAAKSDEKRQLWRSKRLTRLELAEIASRRSPDHSLPFAARWLSPNMKNSGRRFIVCVCASRRLPSVSSGWEMLILHVPSNNSH